MGIGQLGKRTSRIEAMDSCRWTTLNMWVYFLYLFLVYVYHKNPIKGSWNIYLFFSLNFSCFRFTAHNTVVHVFCYFFSVFFWPASTEDHFIPHILLCSCMLNLVNFFFLYIVSIIFFLVGVFSGWHEGKRFPILTTTITSWCSASGCSRWRWE